MRRTKTLGKIKFVSPYQRYLKVLPYAIQLEKEEREKTEKEEEERLSNAANAVRYVTNIFYLFTLMKSDLKKICRCYL